MSLLPYFTWVMVIITLGTIGVQCYELYTTANANPSYVWLADVIFVFATLVELILKVHCTPVLFYRYHATNRVDISQRTVLQS